MIVKPSTEELCKRLNNSYELVNVISKRTRQLQDGKKSLINTNETSKVTIAALEFAENKYEVEENDQ